MQYGYSYISPNQNFMLAVMLAIGQQSIAVKKKNLLTDFN